MKLIIEGQLTSLNEYINAERKNKFLASKIKREETERIIWECRIQKLSLLPGPRFFIFNWYMKDKRKDPDNIAYAKKFVMDGLYKAGIIINDTQEYIKGFVDIFHIDTTDPRVEITTKAHLPKGF